MKRIAMVFLVWMLVLPPGFILAQSSLEDVYRERWLQKKRQYLKRTQKRTWEYERMLRERWGKLRTSMRLQPWWQTEFCESGVDYEKGVMTATCMGEDPEKGIALDRALVRVTDEMVGMLMSLPMSGDRSLEDYLRQKGLDAQARITSFVNENVFLGEGDVSLEEPEPGLRRVKVTYRLPMYREARDGGKQEVAGTEDGGTGGGGFVLEILPIPERAEPEGMSSPPVALQHKATPTGVIIDVEGLDLWPSPVPTVITEKGERLYGIDAIDPRVLERESGASWRVTIEEAARLARAGTSPLKIRPVRISKNNEIVVSAGDARRLREAEKTGRVLYRGRMVVAVGEG